MIDRREQEMADVARAAAKDYPDLELVAESLEKDYYCELSETFIDGMQEVLRYLVVRRL